MVLFIRKIQNVFYTAKCFSNSYKLCSKTDSPLTKLSNLLAHNQLITKLAQ
jgi:hypothetical protein